MGFIIPIFMINNLKGEQLVTYLKAKLEAAKATKKLLAKETEVKEKLKKEEKDDEENLVPIKNKKKDELKNDMHMELDMPENDKTIEEIGERNTGNSAQADTSESSLESGSETRENSL